LINPTPCLGDRLEHPFARAAGLFFPRQLLPQPPMFGFVPDAPLYNSFDLGHPGGHEAPDPLHPSRIPLTLPPQRSFPFIDHEIAVQQPVKELVPVAQEGLLPELRVGTVQAALARGELLLELVDFFSQFLCPTFVPWLHATLLAERRVRLSLK
jgi:hypothetical protein